MLLLLLRLTFYVWFRKLLKVGFLRSGLALLLLSAFLGGIIFYVADCPRVACLPLPWLLASFCECLIDVDLFDNGVALELE